MIAKNSHDIKLVCSVCGQGDYSWSWKITVLRCDFCKKITKWITLRAYHVQKKRKEGSGNATTH